MTTTELTNRLNELLDTYTGYLKYTVLFKEINGECILSAHELALDDVMQHYLKLTNEGIRFEETNDISLFRVVETNTNEKPYSFDHEKLSHDDTTYLEKIVKVLNAYKECIIDMNVINSEFAVMTTHSRSKIVFRDKPGFTHRPPSLLTRAADTISYIMGEDNIKFIPEDDMISVHVKKEYIEKISASSYINGVYRPDMSKPINMHDGYPSQQDTVPHLGRMVDKKVRVLTEFLNALDLPFADEITICEVSVFGNEDIMLTNAARSLPWYKMPEKLKRIVRILHLRLGSHVSIKEGLTNLEYIISIDDKGVKMLEEYTHTSTMSEETTKDDSDKKMVIQQNKPYLLLENLVIEDDCMLIKGTVMCLKHLEDEDSETVEITFTGNVMALKENVVKRGMAKQSRYIKLGSTESGSVVMKMNYEKFKQLHVEYELIKQIKVTDD